MSRSVHVQTVVTVETAGGVPLPAEWVYDTADPYAVELLIFDTETEHSWVFARDLLDVGMSSGTAMGIGDVRIWTCAADLLHIVLDSPFGHAKLTLDHGDAVDFIVATYDQVEEGEEEDFIDIDAEIRDLMAGGAA